MKKIAMLLVLVLAMTCCAGAFAEDFDIGYVLEYPDIYEVSYEDGKAYIESTMSAEERSFVHAYESSFRYSSTQFDILVVDEGTASEYPVFRMWILYCEDNEYKNINSVTFTVNNVDYTFTDIDSEDWKLHDEQGYGEMMLLRFGLENLDFLVALEELIPENYDDLDYITIPMTLHGDEDITVELSGGFMLDFMLIRMAFINTNAIDHMDQTIDTPMYMEAAE